MSENELLRKLEANDFQVTPGALEVFKNSHISINDLVKDITLSWDTEERIITTKRAVKVMLNSQKFSVFSREIAQEIKSRAKQTIVVPRHLMRTYSIIKRFNNNTVNAGQIAQITHRKKATEKIYLEELVKKGFVKKHTDKPNDDYYQIV
jgi:Fic family protein